MNLQGIKHFVQCRCVVKGSERHQFQVFSILEDDVVKSKFVQCNNCGIVHHVDEVSHSRIVDRESMGSIVTIDDIANSLNEKIVNTLRKNNVEDVSVWEEVKFIIENERWGEFVILSKDLQDGVLGIKLIRFVGKNLFVVDNEMRNERI